jgi:hypothetical protein
VPVGAVSRQPGNFQTKHNPGTTHADFRHQFAEAVTIRYRSPGFAQIVVNHRNLFWSPAQLGGSLPEGVLPFRALRVLEHLPQRRLPHV